MTALEFKVYLYIFVMAAVTYLIRLLPITLIRKKITNKFFRSFLYYVPYATLAAMTFPAILYSTSSIISASVGFITAFILSWKGKSLLLVSGCTCVAVFIVEFIMKFI